jgi:hypothetical protein
MKMSRIDGATEGRLSRDHCKSSALAMYPSNQVSKYSLFPPPYVLALVG